MIDLRSTERDPAGLSSLGLELRRAQVTRFYWIRACGECLSRSTYALEGVRFCAGCDRRAILAEHEAAPPEGA